jgi:hypothetical protein
MSERNGITVSRETCDLILTSLSFTRQKFESYPYPTEDIRRQRLADVDTAVAAIRFLGRYAEKGTPSHE